MRRRLILLLTLALLFSLAATPVSATPSSSDWFGSTTGQGGLFDEEVGWGFQFETQEGTMFVALFKHDGDEELCFEGEAESWFNQRGTVTINLPAVEVGCEFSDLISVSVSLDHSAKVEKSDVWVNGRPCMNSEWSDESAAPSLLIVSTEGVEVDLDGNEDFEGNYFMSTQHCPGNPFVGSWENIDADLSHQSLQIAASGRFQYRDDFASGGICGDPGTPFRATGNGFFVEEASPIFVMTGDGFCDKEPLPGDGKVEAEFVYERPDRLRMSDDSCWYRTGSDPTICDAEINDHFECRLEGDGDEVSELTVNNIGTVDLDVVIEVDGFTVFGMALDAGESEIVDVLPGQPWSWMASYNGVFIDGQDGEGPPCMEIAELVYSVDTQCDIIDGIQSQIVLTNNSPNDRSVGFHIEVFGEDEPAFSNEVPALMTHTLDVDGGEQYSWQVEYQGFPVEQSEGDLFTATCPS